MGAPPRFSLVIPARNEEKYLPRLLDSVEVARHRYGRGPDSVEVLVVDNESTDQTARLALERGARLVREGKRVIAAVRNAGARAARGEILAFTDADGRIHPETFGAIERAVDSGRVVGGATGVRMERWSLGIATTYALLVPFVWLTRMDTGVVFCRRADFLAIGGYNEGRAFAEDVQLLLDLRRLGRGRGQRLARVTEAKAIASTRKFDRFGEWHYLTNLGRSLYCLLAGRREELDRFVRTYWYDDLR